MSTKNEVIRTVVSMATGAGLLCVGALLARAVPGGATKGALSFAGTLTDDKGVAIPGAHTLQFLLTPVGGGMACTPPVSAVQVDANGSFTAEIDITGCPEFFDGKDVTVEIKEGGNTVGGGPVNPVPYAKYADRVGYSDCPVGYAKDPNPASPFNPQSILCKNGDDEIVKVGTGASAFWIDRYEASIWTQVSGGVQEFGISDQSSANFPKNGQVLTRRWARSVTSVMPSRSLTWFQAFEACTAIGKRLATGSEWLLAARGTRDPAAANDGATNAKCNTKGAEPRITGAGMSAAVDASCVSDWGAQDMIGNLWEWTDEWYAGVGDASATYGDKSNWPDATFGGDGTSNIVSSANNGAATVTNIPSTALRGGSWGSGPLAGVFALNLNLAPSSWGVYVGFRCVLPR